MTHATNSKSTHRRRHIRHIHSIWQWLRTHYKKILLIAGGLLLAWLVFAISVGVWYQQKHKHDPYEPGVSFSTKYARELGLDWKAVYGSVLNDTSFHHLRLMSYWDEVEPSPNNYQFNDLDWQMDQAAKHGVKVTLTLGKRQPRWPECHQPDWVDNLDAAKQDIELVEFLRAVVTRYKDHPALESYQLENEIANRLFAPHCRTFDRNVLQQEYDTVKEIDSKHPLILNVSNQSGIPWRGPVGDQVGFSIYKIAYARFGPFGYYWSFGYTPTLWHSFRAGLLEIVHDKQGFIHELQAEPWGPAATKELTLEEQNRSMTPKNMEEHARYGYNTGMHRMYLWGIEWAYWRQNKFNDPEPWKSMVKISREVPR